MISAASLTPTLGNDIIHGTTFADIVFLLDGADRCDGQDGNDRIYGGSGVDYIYGGAGNDQLFGGAGVDILSGDAGADTMSGGMGDDVYWVDSAADHIYEAVNAGRDKILSTVSMTIRANFEELQLWGKENLSASGDGRANILVGNSGDNHLYGGDGADNLNGGAGDDFVYGGLGADTLHGGSGSDDLRGGAGADHLNGGLSFDILRGGLDTQRDVFIFDRVADSRAFGPIDVIFDFKSGVDRVDLSGINDSQAAYGAHRISYSGTHSGTYAVWWQKSGGDVILSADTSGDGTADFAVHIAAVETLKFGDIIL